MVTALQPWLYVKNSVEALRFYEAAFRAAVDYRLDIPDGSVIARLRVGAAEFWISEESDETRGPVSMGGHTARMILITEDPAPIFDAALRAGARQVFPISVDHGWRLGRIEDPFGHHWEIGHTV